jgi:hypothetical protein
MMAAGQEWLARRGAALALVGAAMACIGDTGQLWVVNAARPELHLARAPAEAIVWATLLGTIGIPLYALGYCARALRAPRGGFALAAAGCAFAALGGAVHAATGALIGANAPGIADGLAPLQGVLQSGPVSLSLWATAGIAFLVAGGAELRLCATWRERATNPLLLTLAVSLGALLLDLPWRDFVGPAAINLAHLAFFLRLSFERGG